MSWTEVTELVLKAQTGDRAAYGELVERFQGAVYASALTRVRDANEAQELTQEVFVHGMRKIAQLRDPRCFAGWLRRIAARMAINRLSRRGLVRGTESGFLDSVPGRSVDPADSMEKWEAKAELHAGMKRLKELDRQTLEAFYLRGRTLKQMSREFETPVGTIKRRLHVARLRLKDAMVAARPDELNDAAPTQRPRRAAGMKEVLAA